MLYKFLQKFLFLLIIFIVGCEGPEGPEGPMGPEGPAGEIREIIVTVATKMYTANSSWVTIYYDDNETDNETVVIFISYKNINGLWQGVEKFGSYFDGTLYASGNYGYDGKQGYAALIYDPDQDLLGSELKILYIP